VARKARAKRSRRKKERAPERVLASLVKRASVVSVGGPFNARSLIELPTEIAAEILGDAFFSAGPTNVTEAVARDLDKLRERSPELAESTLAATAARLACELENPFNSATSKSMCARSLIEALERLFEQAPDEEQGDRLDDLSARRAARIAGGAKATA
jgi:hypothetical protein